MNWEKIGTMIGWKSIADIGLKPNQASLKYKIKAHFGLSALQCKNSYFGPYAYPARKTDKA